MRVEQLGQDISAHYSGREPVLIGLLKGSYVFLADLSRNINRPHKVDFIRVSSYGNSRISSGRPQVSDATALEVSDRDLLLVEDIIDSGRTLNRLVGDLRKQNPASLEICSLLDKGKAQELELKPRFVGFDAPDRFLVGYGLDLAESWRHLPYIAAVKE